MASTAPDRIDLTGPRTWYRERLNPPAWAYAVVIGLAASLAIAYGVAVGLLIGLITFGLCMALVLWWLSSTTPTIEVTDTEFRVGRAHIGWEFVGIVATLDAEATKAANGSDADPRAFAVSRSLTASQAITFEVCDDSDPHPYWLISTRDPAELGKQMTAARQAFLARSSR